MIEEEIVEIAEGGDLSAAKGQLKPEILAAVQDRPEFAQGIDEIEKRLSRTAMVSEDLDEAIDMLEAVLLDPASYPEMVQAAIMDGLIDEGDAPPEYDPIFIISMLAALYGLQDRMNAQGYARGGLTVAGRKLANQGQGGDSMLAHVNPREAEILKRMGGQGTVNPNTGLAEYKSLKKIFKAILPIALAIFVPGLGVAIGAAMGAGTGVLGAVVGGAILGAGTSLVTGGDPLKGALMGGLSGGLGNWAGSKLAPGLGETGQAIVGNAAVGGVRAGLEGDNILKGVGRGALSGAVQGVGGDGAFNAGIRAGGDAFTGGGNLRDVATSGAAAGLFTKAKELFTKPSEVVVGQLDENLQMVDPLIEYVDPNALINPVTGKPFENQTQVNSLTGKPFENQIQVDMPTELASDMYGQGVGLNQPLAGRPFESFSEPLNVEYLDPKLRQSEFGKVAPIDYGIDYSDPALTLGAEAAKSANDAFRSKYGLDTSNTAQGNPDRASPPQVDSSQAAGSPQGDKSSLLSFKKPDGSIDWKKAGGLGLLSVTALGALSPEIPEELDLLTDGDPERAAMFNRQLTNTNWDQVRADAAAANMSLTEYTSRNFDKVQSTKYQDTPPPRRSYDTGEGQSIRMPGAFAAGPSLYRDPYTQVAARGGRIHMNRGGPLQKASRYVKGGGTGRSDSIPAYLSDGEYVVDAETVAMLGDGSNKAGADVLDKMRSNIRAHKGKALAKGKFSPDSKSPLTYLKGVA